jgi:DNA polymerase (family 10)
MSNQELANILEEIADFLEIEGVEWEVRAYRRAAENIIALSEDISEIYNKNGKKGLMEIKGVGEGISKNIIEYLETGTIPKYKRLSKMYPSKIHDLLGIDGLGPKKLKLLLEKLNITTSEQLVNEAKRKRIRSISGFDEKIEEDILSILQGKQEKLV